jgi:glycosyltransferase involved in cell wall biosynthesis
LELAGKSPKLIRVTTVPMALKVLLPGQMRFMKQNGFDVIMISADGREREEAIQNEGCPHIIVNMTRKITPFHDLIAFLKLVHLFKKHRPDIVHSHTPKAGLLAMLAAKVTRVPLRIHTVAGLRFMTSKGFTRSVLIKMEKLTARSATHIWPNSHSLLNYIKKNKLVNEKKMEVIGHGSSNGINLQRYSVSSLKAEKINEIKKLVNYDEKLIYLVSVGRIVKDKGIDELLKVFTRIHQKNNLLRLILVGVFEEHLDPISPDGRNILLKHPAIIHIDWNDTVEYFMHISYLLVHPSHREGFPNVLLQAGAMECPVVCSRIEGNVDVVDHEINGLVFESQNENALEEKLNQALAQPAVMRNYSAKLRLKIEQYFDQRYVHEQLKKRYLQLLEMEG